VNYPPEWKPSEYLLGRAELDKWVESTNGKYISLEEIQSVPSETVESSVRLEEVWDKLLLAVIVLWPLEIAIRRRWLPWN
jgi:hypothetical protein